MRIFYIKDHHEFYSLWSLNGIQVEHQKLNVFILSFFALKGEQKQNIWKCHNKRKENRIVCLKVLIIYKAIISTFLGKWHFFFLVSKLIQPLITMKFNISGKETQLFYQNVNPKQSARSKSQGKCDQIIRLPSLHPTAGILTLWWGFNYS